MELEDVIKMNCERKITMHVNRDRFEDIKEFEESINKKFENAVVGVFKTKNGYYAEIFILNKNLPEYSKECIQALIGLYILRKQIQEFKDPELNYVMEKTLLSVAKMVAKATDEIVKLHTELNRVYKLLLDEYHNKI